MDYKSLDYEYFENQEAAKIPAFFRMTKMVVITFGVMLSLSMAYSIYRLVKIAQSMEEPFTSLAFDFSFIAVLLEAYIFIFIFPSLFSKEHAFLRGILIFLAIVSALHYDWLLAVVSLWVVIIVTYYVRAKDTARRKYNSYIVDRREYEKRETIKEMREIFR